MENAETKSSSRAVRRALAGALIGLVAIVVAIVFAGAPEALFSDARAPHDTADYDKLQAPIPAPVSADSTLTNVTVIQTNDRVRLTFPNSVPDSASFYDFETIRVAPGKAAELSAGEFDIRYLGVAHGSVLPGDYNARF